MQHMVLFQLSGQQEFDRKKQFQEGLGGCAANRPTAGLEEKGPLSLIFRKRERGRVGRKRRLMGDNVNQTPSKERNVSFFT